MHMATICPGATDTEIKTRVLWSVGHSYQFISGDSYGHSRSVFACDQWTLWNKKYFYAEIPLLTERIVRLNSAATPTSRHWSKVEDEPKGVEYERKEACHNSASTFGQ